MPRGGSRPGGMCCSASRLEGLVKIAKHNGQNDKCRGDEHQQGHFVHDLLKYTARPHRHKVRQVRAEDRNPVRELAMRCGERLLMEELNYNLLFRWFVGLNMDDAVWHPTVYSKNRDRLLEAEVARQFFDGVVAEATQLGLMSDEHFRFWSKLGAAL